MKSKVVIKMLRFEFDNSQKMYSVDNFTTIDFTQQPTTNNFQEQVSLSIEVHFSY